MTILPVYRATTRRATRIPAVSRPFPRLDEVVCASHNPGTGQHRSPRSAALPQVAMSIETRFTEAAAAAVRRLEDDLRATAAAVAADAAATAAAVETRHGETVAALQAQLDDLRADLTARDALIAELRESADSDRTTHASTLVQLRHDADDALAQAEQALSAAIKQAQVSEIRPGQAPEAPAATVDAAATVQALTQAAAAMDAAATLSQVLDALSDGLAAQAPRSAVLVIQDGNARVWRRNGLPQETPEIGTDLVLADHADLAAIASTSEPALVEPTGDRPVLGLVSLPEGHQGLAVPVAIGGQVAALVYADRGDDERQAPGWADAVELLARHAARCLETLTAMRAAGYARTQRPAVVVPMPPHLRVVQRQALDTPMGDAVDQARRVARLLVSEIRLNKEADVMEGRAQGDLGARLGDDIARARRQYLQRVADALPGRDALFDEEVVRTLANGDADLLRTGS